MLNKLGQETMTGGERVKKQVLLGKEQVEAWRRILLSTIEEEVSSMSKEEIKKRKDKLQQWADSYPEEE